MICLPRLLQGARYRHNTGLRKILPSPDWSRLLVLGCDWLGRIPQVRVGAAGREGEVCHVSSAASQEKHRREGEGVIMLPLPAASHHRIATPDLHYHFPRVHV